MSSSTRTTTEAREVPAEAAPTPLGPGSHTWRDFGSRRFQLMLPQAFVLQVAHPVIDAGVSEHSTYRSDPWGRAKRSVEMLWPVVYARPEAAIEKGVALREMHRSIRGVDKRGKRYTALDPEAYSWVHLTGYDATIRMHEFMGRSPDEEERRTMFREWRQLGRMIGVREQDLPATTEEYWDRFHGMIRDRLEMTDVARDLLGEDFYLDLPKPPVRWLPEFAWRVIRRGLARFQRFNLRATLPPAFREKFGIEWTARDQWRFRLWCRIHRVLHALTPRKWRLIPLAREAVRDAERHPEAYGSSGHRASARA